MKLEMYVFDKLPLHDTCWSIISGADNHIYLAACIEYTGGLGAYLVRYNTTKGKIEYMLDVADAVGEPPDNGRATQCKIHYSLLSDSDGIIYGATHLSAPGKGQLRYRPWHNWKDPKRGFPGSMLFAFDPKKEKVLFTDCIIPHEGCRCLALDENRRILYGVSYPRNHFFYYDMEKHTTTVIGRIGNVNPQCIFLDSRNRAYTTTDYGFLIRFDIDKGEFEELDIQVPHAPYQDGLHTILYDVVLSPDKSSVYGIPWSTDPHLFRYVFDENAGPGHIDDLGPALYNRSGFGTSRIQGDHTGGLVFGKDQNLYYCANEPGTRAKLGRRGVDNAVQLMKMDPGTGVKKKVTSLKFGKFQPWYVSRGVRDREGNLYFADVGNIPNRMYKFVPDYTKKISAKKEPRHTQLRFWG